MPQPLPDAVVATLKTDVCAALAAIMVISNAHSELLAWAQRTLSPLTVDRDVASNEAGDGETTHGNNGAGNAPASNEAPGPAADTEVRKANGAGGSNGAAKSEGARARSCHNSREGAASHDQALLALMRANPDAGATEIIRLNGRPRNSTMLSLERLQKAGLVEHASRGKWTVVDHPELVEGPAPKPAGWIAPLSGARVARHAADGRVRDEMTLAAGAH